jgi:hypothetical protein
LADHTLSRSLRGPKSAQQRREQQPRHGAFLENSLVATNIRRETLDHNKLPSAP